ncbi:MAG TPA: EAL domain-containing protein [Acidimicrobiales bacterium]|nr:EAL domain-containing protein [Acidimicrobiales bacterium]
MVRTIAALENRRSLFTRAEGLTVLANAQRQALALQNTLSYGGTFDASEFDTRLGLLAQQTRVMTVATSAETSVEAQVLRQVRADLDALAGMRSALVGTQFNYYARQLGQESAAVVERGIKRLYDIEEREVFHEVDRTDATRRASELTLAALSALTVVFAGAFVVTQRKRARSNVEVAYNELLDEVAERKDAEERFTVGFEQAANGAVLADRDGIPVRVNRAMCEFLGRTPDELVGARWTAFAHPDDPPLGPTVIKRADLGHDHFDDERRYVRPDGSVVWAIATVTVVRDESGEPSYFFAQFQDITERKAMEAALRHRALHDSLTNLPNRALLQDRLAQALARSKRQDGMVGVIFLDLDRFKVVNDAMGHSAGDVLLNQVAQRLTAVIRPEDTLARFGGDEFVVLCEASADEVRAVAARVSASFVAPFDLEHREVHVTASLGIVLGRYGDDADELLQDADVAMYRAKELGRGRSQVFDTELRDRAKGRLEAEASMRQALDADEFVVFFQPIVNVRTGATDGAEALVRWRRPDGEIVSPSEFIPLAEETGLIVQLGERVLEMACQQATTWRRDVPALANFFVSVNVSARQLKTSGLVATVERILETTRLPASALHLEITESVVMEDVDHAINVLGRLKGLGVSLEIDDFGTGYSSLSYLKLLPVDTLKIDRSFVDGLGRENDDSSIVSAIIGLGAALGLELHAEGVEELAQWRALQDLGCDRAQGYLWSPPVAAAHFVVGDAALAATVR